MQGFKIVTSILLLVVICTAEDSEELLEELKMIEKDCRDEVGIERDEIKNFHHNLCNGDEIDRNIGCFMSCFYKKVGAIKDGEYQIDDLKSAILPFIKDEEAKEELGNKLDICKNEISDITDECDKTIAFSKCLAADSKMCKNLEE
ncbi:general odorant-binding protein 2-like [Vespula pensylvanica]|uniref:general odorant-binding protein 2-like n=1 Tax=Vespula pensylvanica TaxID=30213 RepID=UPI001CBA1340|nr:general odorant-binding protein 2-like [Vespula pensylvanica]